MMTTNCGKFFFSEKSARKFMESLEKSGCTDIALWIGNDAFNQKQYTVKWNKD